LGQRSGGDETGGQRKEGDGVGGGGGGRLPPCG